MRLMYVFDASNGVMPDVTDDTRVLEAVTEYFGCGFVSTHELGGTDQVFLDGLGERQPLPGGFELVSLASADIQRLRRQVHLAYELVSGERGAHPGGGDLTLVRHIAWELLATLDPAFGAAPIIYNNGEVISQVELLERISASEVTQMLVVTAFHAKWKVSS